MAENSNLNSNLAVNRVSFETKKESSLQNMLGKKKVEEEKAKYMKRENLSSRNVLNHRRPITNENMNDNIIPPPINKISASSNTLKVKGEFRISNFRTPQLSLQTKEKYENRINKFILSDENVYLKARSHSNESEDDKLNQEILMDQCEVVDRNSCRSPQIINKLHAKEDIINIDGKMVTDNKTVNIVYIHDKLRKGLTSLNSPKRIYLPSNFSRSRDFEVKSGRCSNFSPENLREIKEDVIPNIEESIIDKGGEAAELKEDSMIMKMNENLIVKSPIHPIEQNLEPVILQLRNTTQEDNNHRTEEKLTILPTGGGETLCRICYEGETEEKGGLISPCTCTGSCKYIHESCLKTWIENNFSHNKIKAECEICKHVYGMKFYMKHKFSKVKCCRTLRDSAGFTLIASVIIGLLLAIIYVVVTAVSVLSPNDKSDLINILIGVGIGILVISIVIAFRDCKENFTEPYLVDWKIFNLDGSKYKEHI